MAEPVVDQSYAVVPRGLVGLADVDLVLLEVPLIERHVGLAGFDPVGGAWDGEAVPDGLRFLTPLAGLAPPFCFSTSSRHFLIISCARRETVGSLWDLNRFTTMPILVVRRISSLDLTPVLSSLRMRRMWSEPAFAARDFWSSLDLSRTSLLSMSGKWQEGEWKLELIL